MQYRDGYVVPLYRPKLGLRHLLLSQWVHRSSHVGHNKHLTGHLGQLEGVKPLLSFRMYYETKQISESQMLFERTMFHQYLHCANNVGV